MSLPLHIEVATRRRLRYVLARQREHSNAVGFLRRKDIEYLTARRTVLVPTLGGEPCGVLICSGGTRRPLCLRSNIVERELWEKGLGKAFCDWVATHALARTWGGFRVLTRRDLVRQESINRTLGGSVVSTRPAGARGHAVDEWWVPTKTPAEGHPQRTYQRSDLPPHRTQGLNVEVASQQIEVTAPNNAVEFVLIADHLVHHLPDEVLPTGIAPRDAEGNTEPHLLQGQQSSFPK